MFALIINQTKFKMKKLTYLFVAAIMFAFTACGGGESVTEETVETAVEEVVVEEAVSLDTNAVAEEAEAIEEFTEEVAE